MTKKLDNISKLANSYREYLALAESGELSNHNLGFSKNSGYAITYSMSVCVENYVKHKGETHTYSKIENKMKDEFNDYLLEWLNENIHRCMREIIEKMENDYLKEIDKDIDRTFEELLKLKKFKDKKSTEGK